MTSICTIASFSSNLTFLLVFALPITCDIYMHDCFVLQQLNFVVGTCTPNYLRHLYARLLRSPATYLSCWYLHSQLPVTSICTIASFSSNLTFLLGLALPITCDIYMHDCFVLQQLNFLVGTCTPNYLRHLYARLLRSPATSLSVKNMPTYFGIETHIQLVHQIFKVYPRFVSL